MLYTLFHGTDALFDRFDFTHTVQDGRHDNGALGIWTETRRQVAQDFGRYLLTLEADIAVVFDLPVDKLARMARYFSGPRQYEEFRQSLIQSGHQAIALRELDGQALQMIVIDPGCIRITSCHDSEPLSS